MTTDLVEMVFATKRITFDYKREILSGILNKYYPPLTTIKDEKTLCNKIKDIAEKRNIFAHYPLSVDETSIKFFKENRTMFFLKYNNSQTKEKFTKSDIEKLILEISFCNEVMLKMLD